MRISAALSLVLVIVAGAAVTTSAAVVAADDVPGESAAPTLRLATYNIRAGVSVEAFAEGFEALRPRADVIGLQEVSVPSKLRAVENVDWDYARSGHVRQNPIFWRRDLFDVRSEGDIKIAEGRDLHGEQAATGDESKTDRYATVARLTDRASGTTFSVINVHLTHGAAKGGVAAPGKPTSYKLLCDEVAGTVRAIKAEQKRSQRVFVMGDFNVSFKPDQKVKNPRLPYRQFGKIGYRSMWDGTKYARSTRGTHGDALLDQIWTKVSPESVGIQRDIRVSDHFPATATYGLSNQAGYVAPVATIGFATPSMAVYECNTNGQARDSVMFSRDIDEGYVRGFEVTGDSLDADIRDIDSSGLRREDKSSHTIWIRRYANRTPQADRTITFTLSDPVKAVIPPGQETMTLTIVDDDYDGAPKCPQPPITPTPTATPSATTTPTATPSSTPSPSTTDSPASRPGWDCQISGVTGHWRP